MTDKASSGTDSRNYDRLLPCPFCGGEAHIASDYSSERDETRWNLWHECCQHEGEGAGYGSALFPWFDTPWYKTEAEAIAAWNTREAYEMDGWFYLPKPKEQLFSYTTGFTFDELSLKATGAVDVYALTNTVMKWQEEALNAQIVERICEVFKPERTCCIVKTPSDSDFSNDWRYRCSECGCNIPVNERDPETGDVINAANYCPNCGARVEVAR